MMFVLFVLAVQVLLKCVVQTTAVDMWACGVILLSILSGKTNFFNAPDDLTNLLQLVVLFGKEALCNAATTMGKNLLVELADHGPVKTLKVGVDCNGLHE